MGEGRSGSLPLKRMLVRGSLLLLWWVAWPLPALSSPLAGSDLESKNQWVVQWPRGEKEGASEEGVAEEEWLRADRKKQWFSLSASPLPFGGGNWLYLSLQLLLLFLLSAFSTLTNFSIEQTLQAGPDTGVPDPSRCLTAPTRRASGRSSRTGATILTAGQPRSRGAGRKSRLEWGGSPGLRARSRGCRARGRRLPTTGAHGRSRGSEVPGHTGS